MKNQGVRDLLFELDRMKWASLIGPETVEFLRLAPIWSRGDLHEARVCHLRVFSFFLSFDRDLSLFSSHFFSTLLKILSLGGSLS